MFLDNTQYLVNSGLGATRLVSATAIEELAELCEDISRLQEFADEAFIERLAPAFAEVIEELCADADALRELVDNLDVYFDFD